MEDKNEIVDDILNTPDPYENVCMRETSVEEYRLYKKIFRLIKKLIEKIICIFKKNNHA